jgi:tRNA G18 (ribose-2'-O)-methylase SpoU
VAARLVPVDSLDDPRLAPLRGRERRLTNRPQRRDDAGAGLFVAEGDLVVERALDAGCEPVVAIADAERVPDVVGRLAIDVFVGGDDVRSAVTGLGVAHSVIAAFRRPPRPEAAALLGTCRRLVVLDGVDNPANVGAVVRNAAALGWDGLLLDHSSADPLARRALRVSMGTAFAVPFARSPNLAGDLADAIERSRRDGDPLEVLALTPGPAATPIDAVPQAGAGRRALLVGSERAGLPDALLRLATGAVRIPMRAGVDSLNVAAATAIACHVLRR